MAVVTTQSNKSGAESCYQQANRKRKWEDSVLGSECFRVIDIYLRKPQNERRKRIRMDPISDIHPSMIFVRELEDIC